MPESFVREYTAHVDQLHKRQATLEAEHSRQMGIIERFENNPRALKKKQEELARLEADLKDAETDLEYVNEKILAQLRRWSELQALIRQVQSTGSSEQKCRARTEALSRLVERIDVFFVPTGKKYPQSLPETVVIVPKAGTPVRYDVSCCRARVPLGHRSCAQSPRPGA